jgi:ABC-type cobalamin/Fe3+-siderophores transport system ATPase subunit
VADTCLSVYDEILNWSISSSRPAWQRDALRRLVVNGALTEEDIEETLLLIKAAYGIIGPSQISIAPIPLDPIHICPDSAADQPVSLSSISDVCNVNAICSGKPLTFNENGMTIVYGENGTGKSGYVRILKALCRARTADNKIFPNVFSDDYQKPKSACVNYKHGASGIPFVMEEGKPAPQELSCINVFDMGCASLYVNDESKIVYMPLGLDVFDKLVKACDKISASLDKEKRQHPSELPPLPPEYLTTTSGVWYKFVLPATGAGLKDIDSIVTFDEAETRRLEELNRVLSEDSKKKRAAELRTKEERYRKLLSRFKTISSALSQVKIQSLKDAKAEYDRASRAAELASKTAFESDLLKGKDIGSNPWIELWKAAKAYSEMKVYPTEEFPYLGKDAVCVLCFQQLKPEAKERMDSFRRFVQGATEQKKAEAEQELEKARQALDDVMVSNDDDETLLKELKQNSEDVERETSQFLKAAKALKTAALAGCLSGTWEGIAPLSSAPDDNLQNLCDTIIKEADDLERADDPDERKKLQAEQLELKAKKWVYDQNDSIKTEVSRLSLIAKYDKAIHEAETGQITKQGTVLTDKHVTEELKSRFITYLGEIFGGDIKIALEKTRGDKGITYYKLKLKGCKRPKTEASGVISEGEFHAAGLAAFLAETSFTPAKSGIVLDDPVSSLDHIIRENVADQLAAVAKERQVIIFTHDLFFFVTLQEAAKKKKVKVLLQTVERGYDGTGICTDEMAWETMTVKERIRKMGDLVRDAEEKYKQGKKEYGPYADSVCKKFRQTIERAVEEVLLRHIVGRYRRNIRPTNIKELNVLKKEDWEILECLYDKYSKYEHDQTVESKVPMPTPTVIEADVKQLDIWIGEFNKRVDSFNKALL